MGLIAAILGGIGGVCAILGVLTILDVFTINSSYNLTWDFWLIISAVLFLASIAISVGYKGGMTD